MHNEDTQYSELRKQAEERVRARHKDPYKDPLKLPPEKIPVLIHELEVHQIELEMQNEELQHSHTELELARDRYAELFEFAPVGYLILDPNGQIVRANLTSAELLATTREQLYGKEFYQFFTREHRDTLFRHLRYVFKYQAQQSCEAEVVASDGSGFFVKLDSAPQPNVKEGGNPRCLTLLSDISELKIAEAASRQAMEAAEEASREKSHFLAAASHDLRQPLQAITIYNNILTRTLHDSEALELVSKMSEILSNMSTLFNSLLSINQLESGSVTPVTSKFPVDELLNRIDRLYRPLAEKKGLYLRVVNSSAIVNSDPVLLGQIFDNLVSNAIRYTERGRVLVGCRRQGSNLRIEVWDTGIGISAEKHEQVFKDYYQLANPARDRNNGLGLGLSIAARSARLLKGHIELRSWNKGSLFWMETPLADYNNGHHEQISASTTIDESIASGVSLLVVDDDKIVLLALTVLLEMYGYKVTAAKNGQEVLAMIEKGSNSFDFIVTDYLLPNGETGVDLIKTVRHILGSEIPALILTGNLEVSKTQEVDALGLRVFQKPVLPELLNTYIQEMLA